MIDAITQCGTVQCMQYVIEAIRDYDQVQPEDVTALLSGMSAVRKPSPMLFIEVLVSLYFSVHGSFFFHSLFPSSIDGLENHIRIN